MSSNVDKVYKYILLLLVGTNIFRNKEDDKEHHRRLISDTFRDY